MKIGIVCYPTYGGSGVVATELGKALAAKGHQIHFITYSLPVRLVDFSENIFYHEVNVVDYPLFDYPPYELILSSKLVDVVQYEKLDLLHVHYAIPHASAAYLARSILAARGIKIPYITTLHGTDITLVGKDSSFEPVITFAINESDAVTAVSQSLKADTLRLFKVSREVQVIPNFVCINDGDRHSKRVSDLRAIYAPDGQKIVSHVSNFRKVKRVEDTMKIFAKIREQIPAKMLYVGDGPERSNVERLCREMNLQDSVQMLGKVKFPADILAVSDLFLLTSDTESFGLAALEAMAEGVPVVSSNTGGTPEVNKHGYSGFLSEVGNVSEMAYNALKLLTNEKLLAEFKSNARLQAEQFDIGKVLPLYEKLYSDVLARAKA